MEVAGFLAIVGHSAVDGAVKVLKIIMSVMNGDKDSLSDNETYNDNPYVSDIWGRYKIRYF